MPQRFELVPFKAAWAKYDAVPGKVLFNRDEGRLVKKPTIYVLDAEQLKQHVPEVKDPQAVIPLVCVPFGIPLGSVKQCIDENASAPVDGSYIRVNIEKVQESA
uniref:Uncharacterized protein n=1 Tax=Neobodo designis TaxID=312471 RepID=A0A7S1LWE6_NEODS